MSEELPRSVQDVVSGTTSAVGVSVVTTGSALGTLLEILPPVLGIIGLVCGIFLSILLARNHMKRYELMEIELKLKNAQLKKIDDRKEARE